MTRQASPPPSLPGRVLGVFVAPRRVFPQIAERAPWVDALLLTTLAAIVVAGTQPGEVFLEQARDAVTRRGEPVEVTSPPSQIILWGRLLAMMSALAVHPLLVLSVAGVLALLFGVLGGGRAEFRRYLAVAAHAMLVVSAGALLAIPLRLRSGDPHASWSLALLLPDGAAGFAATLLGSLDPFSLWAVALLALGVSAVEPRFSLGRALVVLLGSYLGLAALGAWILT